MADDNVFAADPSAVQAGGGVTDQVGQLAQQLATAYEDASGYDPNNSPFGPPDDPTVMAIQSNYYVPHGEMRDALNTLAAGIRSAAELTVTSGTNFGAAQDDALTSINAEGGGTGTGTRV